MHRRPRSIATLTLAALLAALLTACGGATGTTAPDDDSDPIGGDAEPYWEMTVNSGDDEPFDVTGTSVAFSGPNVVVLGASEPAGWSVSFTITGDLPIGLPYFTGNGDLLNATVGTPTGSDCVATSETNYSLPSFVNLAPAVDGVPLGNGAIYVDGACGPFATDPGFLVGFGVQ
ncbi:MAG: hypothetical protein ABR510_05880 [Trueperaceae bacterium]